MSLCITQVLNDPIPSNCFVIYDLDISQSCILVDPGSEECSTILHFLESNHLLPEYIILTHEHFDHIWSCNKIKKEFGTKIICSFICSEAIADAKKNQSLFYNQKGFAVLESDYILENNNFVFNWNGYVFDFFLAQGHTSAGVCFTLNNCLFTGDSLIGGIRTITKLYSGSKDKLKETIKVFSSLKGRGYKIYPGHGETFMLDSYDLSIALK